MEIFWELKTDKINLLLACAGEKCLHKVIEVAVAVTKITGKTWWLQKKP